MNRHPSGQASAKRDPVGAGDHEVDISSDVTSDSLARLLAAAAAPAYPGELLGEERAAAAFRSAAALPAPSAIRDRRSRRVTVAVAVQAACALLVALGGVALAAGTGVLPNPLVDVSTSQPAPPTATPVATVSTADPSLTAPATAAVSDSPTGEPVPASLFGLCQAYQAHGGDSPSLSSEGFAALAAAAEGAERIPEFCADILSDEPGKSGYEHVPPTAPPGQSAQNALGRANREPNAGVVGQ